VKSSAMRQCHGTAQDGPVLLFDVMDTIVRDPFFHGMHEFFGFSSFDHFLEAKHPTAWVEFELGQLTEQEFGQKFLWMDVGPNEDFSPRLTRSIDIESFKSFLYAQFEFMDGMETLLSEIHSRGIPMHLFSNYPPWWKLIEQKLSLTRFAPWTFVSCQLGIRKPDPAIFQHVAHSLGRPASDLILIDNSYHNCEASLQFGFQQAIHFQSTRDLRHHMAPWFPSP